MGGEFEKVYNIPFEIERKGRLMYFLEKNGEEFTTRELANLCRMTTYFVYLRLRQLEYAGRVQRVGLVSVPGVGTGSGSGSRKMTVWKIKT